MISLLQQIEMTDHLSPPLRDRRRGPKRYVRRALTVFMATFVAISGPFLVHAIYMNGTVAARMVAILIALPWAIFVIWMIWAVLLWMCDPSR